MRVFLLLVWFSAIVDSTENNVCPTFRDYATIKNNTNCWYNFAADVTVPDIIRMTGYPFMQYKVQTRDGYILTVFRIPSVHAKRGPVFLQHGMQSTSALFVSLGRDSLAFLLAEAGYDVWLGNYRGTEYSEGHVSLNVSGKDYWNYGADEIALIDVPTMLNLVKHHTSQKGKIVYVGHSLGSSAALMYASEFPELAKETVKLFILMSPAYKMRNIRSPYRIFLPFLKTALTLTNNLNVVQVISRGYARRITKPTCLASPALMLTCLNLLNLFTGSFNQMAPENVPVLFNQFPGGTSLKTIVFLQDSVGGRFGKYDYGGKNMLMYGNSTPPDYDVTKIQVPVFLVYANNDWATTKADSLNLFRALPKKSRLGVHGVSNFFFNHFDFLFGKNVKTLVYDGLLKLINGFDKNLG